MFWLNRYAVCGIIKQINQLVHPYRCKRRCMFVKKVMTGREEKFMEYFWEQDEPVTVADIEEHFAYEKLSKAAVFKIIQAMMDKGFIRVNGLERTNKTYARKFEAAISKEEYWGKILASKGMGLHSLRHVTFAMLGDGSDPEDDEADRELIKELEGMIDEIKSRGK